MAKQEIDIGVEGNDGTGDSIRESFKKVNENFTELYAVFGLGGTISFTSLDDTPSNYFDRAGTVPLVSSTEEQINFAEFVSDNDGSTTRDSVTITTEDPLDATVEGAKAKIKIVINDPHLERDPDPKTTAPLNLKDIAAYDNLTNTAIRNTSGGDDLAQRISDWNTAHPGETPITNDNFIPSKGYIDDNYVNIDGDTMTGALNVPGGATGTQVPQTQEVITRGGSAANRTMLDTLTLADHPSPLEGFGTPSGSDDLQAVTKLYVDTQGFSSTTNIFVSTQGDDTQSLTPPGKEGRSQQYAYKTINAAMRKAEAIIEGTPYEPGPYVQTITINDGEENSLISAVVGVNSASAESIQAASVVDANKISIQNDVITYINTTYPDFIYNEELCKRDVGLILDSIKLDVQGGLTSNYLTRWAGLRYSANPSAIIAKTTQQTETIDGIREAQRLITDLLDVDAGVNTATVDAYDDRFDELITYLDDNDANDAPLVTGSTYTFRIGNNGFPAVDQGIASNPDLIEGKIIVGRTSGAKGVIVNYLRGGDNGGVGYDEIEIDLLEPIEFEVGEEVEFGKLTRNNQVTVRVESGIYEEQLPIKLPENVSIKGDEFRRVVLRPKPGTSTSKWATTYFYRDIIIDGLNAAYSPIATLTNIGAADPARPTGTYTIAKDEYTTSGNGSAATFTVVVDGVGGATITIDNPGDGFIVGETVTIPDNRLGTGGAADLTFEIATTGGGYHFTHPVSGQQGKYGYHYLSDPLDDTSTPLDNREMDVFLCNDGVIVRNITVQRHGGFMMVLDPEGQILTRSPYCQTGSSFSQSKGTNRNFAGGLFADGYAGNMPATIDTVSTSLRLEVSSPAGQGLFVRKPPTPFPFFVDGIRYQVNTITDYDQSAGTATLILDETSNTQGAVTRTITGITKASPAVVTTSDSHGFVNGDEISIQSVNGMTEINGTITTITVLSATEFTLDGVDSTLYSTYVDGGVAEKLGAGLGWQGGTGVDIFLQSGGNRSMLANDFTQINDLGYGALLTNNALAELVSMFTYYCHTGYLADKGSQIRSIAGNNSYGFYGMVASGSDPDEIATGVQLRDRMVFPAKTFNASHVLEFGSGVPAGANIGDTITQATSGATAIISFKTDNDTKVYVRQLEGVFDTANTVTADAGATSLGVPLSTTLVDASAPEGSLFLFAYDLRQLPLNVSEVEVYHDSALYQPYELTNASQSGVYLNSYEIGDTVAYKSNTGVGTGLVVTIAKNRTDGYKIIDFSGGSGYVGGDVLTVSGADLGGVDGASPNHDASIVIDTVDGGVPTEFTITGDINTDDATPVLDGKVWRFNFGTGIEGTTENGLQETTLHDTPLVIRAKQNFVFTGVTSLPVRPSTAITFTDDTDEFTYRSIAFTTTITDGFNTGNNESVITFDENFRYIDLTTDIDIVVSGVTENLNGSTITVNPGFTDTLAAAGPTTATLGFTAGDRFIGIQRLDETNQARIADAEIIFTWGGKTHRVLNYSEYTYSPGVGSDIEFGLIQIEDVSDTDVNWPATASGLAESLTNSSGITLKGGLDESESASITVNISTCRATGHDMLDIGTGGFNESNYPNTIFGQPVSKPVTTNDAIDSTGNRSRAQVQERDKGRVFTVMTDQDGFFRVGRFFTVDQGTGSVTFNAALVLTNIDGIGFKRGVRVNEFSNDDTFTDAKGDAVPTQTAVEGYIDARLGINRDGETTGIVNIGPGVMSLGGPGYDVTPMQDDMNLGGFLIRNLQTPVLDFDAATKEYVDGRTDQLNDIGDVTLTGSPTAADVLIFTGTNQESENATFTGDIALTRSAANTITAAISPGVIVNADVATSAAIAQSKLAMNAADTAAAAPGSPDQSVLGLARFDSSRFAATNGWITFAPGGITNADLQNDSVTIGSTEIELGATSTSLAGMTGIGFSSGGITGTASWSATGAFTNVTTITTTGLITTGNGLTLSAGSIAGAGNGGGADNGQTIGSPTDIFNAIYATTFEGEATSALYADLAENYLGDEAYEPGTVLVFGGDAEVTECSIKGDTRVAGVVTTNPAHLMNSHLKGDTVVGLALTGRVPCKVIGKVAKGDMLVTSAIPGYAMVNNSPGVGQVIGKAVGVKDDEDRGIVEVVVGRV